MDRRAMIAGVKRAEAALRRAARHLVRDRSADTLTVLALLGSFLLIWSESLGVVRFVDASGALIEAPGAVRDGADQHGHALLVIGVAAIAAVFLARISSQPLPAWGLAALGAIALLTVLIVDVRDATSSGVSQLGGQAGNGLQQGEAQAAGGLWIALAGSLMVLGAGIGLARTLTRAARSSAEGHPSAPARDGEPTAGPQTAASGPRAAASGPLPARPPRQAEEPPGTSG